MKINVFRATCICSFRNCKIANLQFYLHLQKISFEKYICPSAKQKSKFQPIFIWQQIGPVWTNQVFTFFNQTRILQRKEPIYKLSDVNYYVTIFSANGSKIWAIFLNFLKNSFLVTFLFLFHIHGIAFLCKENLNSFPL